MKDRAKFGIGTTEPTLDWDSIDWVSVEKRVSNLRRRIFRATQQRQWNKVRSLMKLMLRSFSNLLLSVRKVTQKNKGKKTPGIDDRMALTSKARARLVRQLLNHAFWNAKPGRRVYIPKANGKRRPLGILTITNRAVQAVVKNALEPSWEARFEAASYGFRPGRSCHDAIEHCFGRLRSTATHRWVLDCDVEAAFDNISHKYILDRIGAIPGRELIKQWLKAGYVEKEIFYDTTSGVQQGGVISPLIANIALDGLGAHLGPKYGYIRYADDFVITAKSQEDLIRIKPAVQEWLQMRGLSLNAAKTKIVHVTDGFDFLGFHIQLVRGKCLCIPQKEKVLELLRRIRIWLKEHQTVSAETVVRKLIPMLLGWANFYKHAVSSRVFKYVDHQIWKALWIWCVGRHPNKGKFWIARKYFTEINGYRWTFYASTLDKDDNLRMLHVPNIGAIPIRRHVKVRGDASPDDPALREYWEERQHKRKRPITVLGNYAELLED